MKKTAILIFLVLFSCTKKEIELSIPQEFSNKTPTFIVEKTQDNLLQLFNGLSTVYSTAYANQLSCVDRSTFSDCLDPKSNHFEGIFSNIINAIKQIRYAKELATNEEDKNLEGVCQIIEGLIFSEFALFFGDVPFSDIKFGNSKYNYSSQIDVLNQAQSLFDLGIQNVGDLDIEKDLSKFSSSANWKELAYSFKARYYLLTKNYSKALENVKKGINNPSSSLKTSSTFVEDHFFKEYFTETRLGDFFPKGTYLEKLVDINNTTVTRILPTPGEEKRYNHYYSQYDRHSPTEIFFNVTNEGIYGKGSNIEIISYEEVLLIEAECLNRLNMSGDIEVFNTFRGLLSTKYQGNFTNTTSTGSNLLKEILEERYITFFSQNIVFHDIRRTNNKLNIPYPQTQSGQSVYREIFQRFLYPDTEIANGNLSLPIPSLTTKTAVNQ